MTALIGSLRATLSADTANFEAGMRRAQRQAATSSTAISKSLGVIKSGLIGFASGLSVGLIAQGLKASLDYAAALGEVSQQLGVTSRDLQVFRYAAGQVGVSQGELETGLSKLTITLGKVAAGAKAPAEALNAIGISADELKGKDTGEAFRIIADGLQNISDRSQRAAVEVALFGRSGAQLDNLLAGGSAAINGLAQAAEELGIILTPEQIRRADDAADKFDALKTVLSAQISGIVADNATAIIGFADSLAYLAKEAADVIRKVQAFYRTLAIESARFVAAHPTASKVLFGTKGSAALLRAGAGAIRSNIADKNPRGAEAPATGSGEVGQFLAGGGGGGGRKTKDRSAEEAERKRLEALRDAYQFAEEQRRMESDILRAKQSLATDYVARTALSIQILNLEKEGFEAELQYRIAAKELTEARAAELRARYEIRDSLERQAVLQEEEERRLDDYNRLAELDDDLARDRLESEAQLADTAAERRDVELRLLDLAYRQERARLKAIIAEEEAKDIAEQNWARLEEARRQLENMDKTEGNDRQAVLDRTKGPLETHFGDLPTDAEKMNEALENVAANGLQSLEDGIVDVITGTKSLKEAFHNMAAQILADLIRIAVQKYIIGTIMKVTGMDNGFADGGMVPGYASGGFVSGKGGPREDKVPAMLSAGEFVINAASTKKFLPILKSINEGEFGRFAMGGLSIPRPTINNQMGDSYANGMAAPPPVSMQFNNDFRGADTAAVGAIQARLNRMEAELPGRVVQAYQDAKSRFVIRD